MLRVDSMLRYLKPFKKERKTFGPHRSLLRYVSYCTQLETRNVCSKSSMTNKAVDTHDRAV